MQPPTSNRPPRVLAVGASARAISESLVRGGAEVVAADLFADYDLRQVAARAMTVPWDHYPVAFADLDTDSADVAVYTGGLERRPDVLQKIERRLPVVGCGHQVLWNLGSPAKLLRFWQQSGFAIPRTVFTPHDRLDSNTRWIRKDAHSSGGLGHRWATHKDLEQPSPRSYYFQEFVDGTPYGGSYLATPSGIQLLGVCRQLVGENAGAPRPFQFAGAIGPLPLAPEMERTWSKLGQITARRFQLQGLFGIDAIEVSSRLYPLEVNPRYTASMELIERATGTSLMKNHLACLPTKNPSASQASHNPIWRKRIHYAEKTMIVSEPWLAERLGSSCNGYSRFADLPNIGTRVERGHPLLTEFTCE